MKQTIGVRAVAPPGIAKSFIAGPAVLGGAPVRLRMTVDGWKLRGYAVRSDLALFNHDRHEQSQARVLTLERLDVAIARSREAATRLSAVLLIGHADRTAWLR